MKPSYFYTEFKERGQSMENSKVKILLVDDEPDILEFIGYNLKKEDYAVFYAKNGVEAIQAAKKESPDLIILDIMMPGMDGIETCREIRESDGLKDVLIIFLTARNEDYSQIAGFDVGADDFISKPVRPRVLISRIRAVLRRKGRGISAGEKDGTDVSGGLRIDKEKYTVTLEGEPVLLRKKEFELLSLLASKPGKVFGRDEILNRVWGEQVVVGDRTVDVHVNKLREKLGEKFIRTIKGVGYKFEF
jgi:two-component system alkaline phosphatase synthesis response regulator PhoP